MIIRAAALDDMQTIADIYAHAVNNFAATYETDPPSLAEMTRRYDAMVRRGLPYNVACDEVGKVLGFAYANLFKERLAYRFMLEDSIYIAPDAQKMGVGSALLTSLIETCTRDGYRQMIAVIGDADRSAGSIAIHTKMGFEECGRFTGSGYKFGRWLDTILMQKQLGDGKTSLPNGTTIADNLTL